jgi:hypothetical protein
MVQSGACRPKVTREDILFNLEPFLLTKFNPPSATENPGHTFVKS